MSSHLLLILESSQTEREAREAAVNLIVKVPVDTIFTKAVCCKCDVILHIEGTPLSFSQVGF